MPLLWLVYRLFRMNDMLHEFSESIVVEAILFEEVVETHLQIPEVKFIRKPIDDNNPQHYGGYVLEYNGQEVASGGFLTNYNKPYGHLHGSRRWTSR